ncbi:hypothetical protein IP81_02740 [Novosphingobium sp. AAP83]|uniref:photosynthetic complex assembly protein PuhC n=1 Tax=Novosphingobium sp. AAP83 TaxID=1523425 RepID=UPI0006B9A90E|nr:photosynthetic complex assembly protein PuhC [Novosphingobium sp. AAP83]KPF93645.1 hypothetical protein IP81_02740 [Novosphingobium sp. AAP83]
MSLVHDHETTVSRPILLLAGGLVAITLLLTASVSFGLVPREAVPSVVRAQEGIVAIETRNLSFADRADGAVAVIDADTKETLAVLLGENDGGGFIRGVMRGLARERRMHGLGAQAPFSLTHWQNGALSLVDTGTGRSIELGSFGPQNRAAFARFLKSART